MLLCIRITITAVVFVVLLLFFCYLFIYLFICDFCFVVCLLLSIKIANEFEKRSRTFNLCLCPLNSHFYREIPDHQTVNRK